MRVEIYRNLNDHVMLAIGNHCYDVTLAYGTILADHIYSLGNKKGFEEMLNLGCFGLSNPPQACKHYSVLYPTDYCSRYIVKEGENLIGSFVNRDIAERVVDELNAKELLKDKNNEGA